MRAGELNFQRLWAIGMRDKEGKGEEGKESDLDDESRNIQTFTIIQRKRGGERTDRKQVALWQNFMIYHK